MLIDVKYSLLYVEDDDCVRKAAVQFLQDQFSAIYEARNGIEALRLYRDKKPDIVITDIDMPGIDGLEFCKEIRKKDSETPIIIMTAYSHLDYLLKATEVNLIKYLIKPIEEESLSEALKACFKKIESHDMEIVGLGKNYYYDMLNNTLIKNKKAIRLTASQALLLNTLINNRGQIVSYEQLENTIWYDSSMSKDALRCLVRDVRKITYKGIVENISKLGYRIQIDG